MANKKNVKKYITPNLITSYAKTIPKYNLLIIKYLTFYSFPIWENFR